MWRITISIGGKNRGSDNVECGFIVISKKVNFCCGRGGDREEALTPWHEFSLVNICPPHKIGQLFCSAVHHSSMAYLPSARQNQKPVSE